MVEGSGDRYIVTLSDAASANPATSRATARRLSEKLASHGGRLVLRSEHDHQLLDTLGVVVAEVPRDVVDEIGRDKDVARIDRDELRGARVA